MASMKQGIWKAREELASDDELALLKAAVAAVQHGLAIARVEPDHRLPLVYANTAFLSQRDQQAQDLIGRDCRQILDGPSQQQAWELLRNALVDGQPAQATWSRSRESGAQAWVEITLTPVGPGGPAEPSLSGHDGREAIVTGHGPRWDQAAIDEVARPGREGGSA